MADEVLLFKESAFITRAALSTSKNSKDVLEDVHMEAICEYAT